MHRINVDLPEPDGHIKTIISPFSNRQAHIFECVEAAIPFVYCLKIDENFSLRDIQFYFS